MRDMKVSVVGSGPIRIPGNSYRQKLELRTDGVWRYRRELLQTGIRQMERRMEYRGLSRCSAGTYRCQPGIVRGAKVLTV